LEKNLQTVKRETWNLQQKGGIREKGLSVVVKDTPLLCSREESQNASTSWKRRGRNLPLEKLLQRKPQNLGEKKAGKKGGHVHQAGTKERGVEKKVQKLEHKWG